MTQLVPLVMFGWPLAVLVLFVLFQPRQALIVSFLAGWMFLPMGGQATWAFAGLPNYDKMAAVSLAVLMAVMVFDPNRLMSFKPRWFDIPMVVWLIVPIFSTVANDPWDSLGRAFYGGLTLTADHLLAWGIPYYLGRVYFNDFASLRELAVGLFIAGLVYVPFCLYEVRFSPQLHYFVYGYHHRGWDAVRLGGFRPKVFMDTGLQVGLWMTITSVAGVWLWSTGALRGLGGVPMWFWTSLLLVTTFLCKSTGALGLLVAAVGALFTLKWFGLRVALVVLMVATPLYITIRANDLWSGEGVIALIETTLDRSRAASFEGRLENETLLVEKALTRPLLGWSAWDRSRVVDDAGQPIATPDGMWVIALGRYGLIGLSSMVIALLLPMWLLLSRFPPSTLTRATVAPVLVLAVAGMLFMLDCLLNAMLSPVYSLLVGGAMSVAGTARVVRPDQLARKATPPASQPGYERGHLKPESSL